MKEANALPRSERDYLRELARRQRETAALPEMARRQKLWYLHNALQGERPMVVLEEDTFLEEILPPPRCQSGPGRWMERTLLQPLTAHELFDDDKVMPDFFPVFSEISTDFLGQKLRKVYAADGVAYHIEPVLEELEEDLSRLEPSRYVYDAGETQALRGIAEDTLGDILPVVVKNRFNHWGFGITQWAVNLMGMENMFCAMMQEPEAFHRLMRLITDDLLRCLRWQEQNSLLPPNNGNDYMGSGSYCFTRELPRRQGPVRSTDTWGHLNSQESVGVSPATFREFIYPYYEELAARFGMVYYGCCEPVSDFWDECLHALPNLRKVSISPWCREEMMGERLRGGSVIYSRKPSPNFLGVGAAFDRDAFTASIEKTAQLAKGCKAEFIFRDVYTLGGNLEKLREAVNITRNIAQTMY